jgi:hypothetical protein
LCLWIGRINAIKILLLTKETYRFKTILMLVWNHKKLQITKAILSKKKKAGITILPDFKIYYKATVFTTACC